MIKGKIEGIYGNETGIILGVNKNKTIKDLKLEKFKKTDKNKEELRTEKEVIYWSDIIKEIICKEFTIRSGKKVRKELKIVIDEEYDFMHCKVDRRFIFKEVFRDNDIINKIIEKEKKFYDELKAEEEKCK